MLAVEMSERQESSCLSVRHFSWNCLSIWGRAHKILSSKPQNTKLIILHGIMLFLVRSPRAKKRTCRTKFSRILSLQSNTTYMYYSGEIVVDKWPTLGTICHNTVLVIHATVEQWESAYRSYPIAFLHSDLINFLFMCKEILLWLEHGPRRASSFASLTIYWFFLLVFWFPVRVGFVCCAVTMFKKNENNTDHRMAQHNGRHKTFSMDNGKFSLLRLTLFFSFLVSEFKTKNDRGRYANANCIKRLREQQPLPLSWAHYFYDSHN